MEFKIALVDLTGKKITDQTIPEDVLRKYIGGSGLGTYLLFLHGSPAADPLSPDNPLIVMNGPFQGTGIPTSGRHQIVSKSPLTGVFGESDCGGFFGFHLKRGGYDGLVILGKASSPVYLAVIDGKIEIKDGSFLWGKDSFETEELLLEKEGKPAGVACIGPAGERQIALANIMHDGSHARAAGRGGLGAVMGSKNLKAIVARGTAKAVMADEKAVRAKSAGKSKYYREKLAAMSKLGTAGGVTLSEKNGDLPLKNWSQGSWPEVQSITGEAMPETILMGNWGCMACPIRCGREVAFDGISGGGPEYETIGMLGSNCLISDLKAIGRGNDLCNRAGIDTISGGSVVAFAMELFERGIITEAEVGYPLLWGDGEAMVRLLGDVVEKKGFGAILADGTRKAAERIGKGSERYAIHSKGMDFPAHDPRCYKSLATGYATSNRGACHLSGFTYSAERNVTYPELGVDSVLDRTVDEGKGKLNVPLQNMMGILDSLKMCKFPFSVTSLDDILVWLNGITGWDVDREELFETGARIFNLKRVFNVACGLTREDDSLPERILTEPRGTGGSADTLPDLQFQLEEYYPARGWSSSGIPLPETLRSLGLEECIPLTEHGTSRTGE
ncbi:MAG: aldehyde ferredoxin oxidoreductase family protein [Synergistaceae bacterium]|nr:aldehyde ferredoxin oxidoreductase family protein [Synergistaceae bacterium]